MDKKDKKVTLFFVVFHKNNKLCFCGNNSKKRYFINKKTYYLGQLNGIKLSFFLKVVFDHIL